MIAIGNDQNAGGEREQPERHQSRRTDPVGKIAGEHRHNERRRGEDRISARHPLS